MTDEGLCERALREVILRLGMTHDLKGDFEHPEIAETHPLRAHVLYCLSAQAWAARVQKP